MNDIVILRAGATPSGPALVLRPWRIGDVAALVDVFRDPVLRRWTSTAVEDDPDTRVRFMVAMKRKPSPDLLEILARDADESIRMKVARHRNTSRETLESLRNDPWKEVRAVVDDRLGGMVRRA